MTDQHTIETKAVTEVRCARCTGKAFVSTVGAEAYRRFNKQLRVRGEKPRFLDETALCDDCYRAWQVERASASAALHARESAARARFKEDVNDQGEEFAWSEVPDEFRRDFQFKKWAGEFIEWHAKQASKPSKRKF